MNWGRAKTILIVLFLMIDVLLLSLIIYSDACSSRISEKNIDETVLFLNNSGIEISKDIISRKKEKNIQIEITEVFSDVSDASKKILGKERIEKENGVYIEGSRQLFKENDKYWYKNSRILQPAEQYDDTLKNVKRELKGYGFKVKKYIFEYVKDNGKSFDINMYLTYHGKKVIGSEISITADKEGILKMSGPFAEISAVSASFEKLPDVTAVLVNAAYEGAVSECNITKIELVYRAEPEAVLKGKALAYPEYMVTFRAGEKQYSVFLMPG